MGKTLFNEAELYLIRNWSRARLLEESMQEVRDKYRGLGKEVVERIREDHPALDWDVVYLCPKSDSGGIGIGRSAWPKGNPYNLGLYVEPLELELLAAGEEDEVEDPCAFISTQSASSTESREPSVTQAVNSAASRLLTEEELKRLKLKGKARKPLWYKLPETRRQLLDMLLDGDGRGFVKCISAHFEILARFIPVLDEVCAETDGKK